MSKGWIIVLAVALALAGYALFALTSDGAGGSAAKVQVGQHSRMEGSSATALAPIDTQSTRTPVVAREDSANESTVAPTRSQANSSASVASTARFIVLPPVGRRSGPKQAAAPTLDERVTLVLEYELRGLIVTTPGTVTRFGSDLRQWRELARVEGRFGDVLTFDMRGVESASVRLEAACASMPPHPVDPQESGPEPYELETTHSTRVALQLTSKTMGSGELSAFVGAQLLVQNSRELGQIFTSPIPCTPIADDFQATVLGAISGAVLVPSRNTLPGSNGALAFVHWNGTLVEDMPSQIIPVEVSRAARFRVRVTDAESGDFVRATVRFIDRDGAPYSSAGWEADRYTLDCPMASTPTLDVAAPGYVTWRQTIDAVGAYAGGASIEVELERDSPATGRVVDRLGNPVAGLPLGTSRHQGRALPLLRDHEFVTDAAGDFAIRGMSPAGTRIGIAAPPRGTRERWDGARLLPNRVRPGDHDITLTLVEMFDADGTASESDGKPVESAIVSAVWRGTANTGEPLVHWAIANIVDGQFTIEDAFAGEWELDVRTPGFAGEPTAVTIEEGRSITLEVSDDGARLHGDFMWAGDNPVTDASVTISSADPDTRRVSTITDENGLFEFRGVADGHYLVEARSRRTNRPDRVDTQPEPTFGAIGTVTVEGGTTASLIHLSPSRCVNAAVSLTGKAGRLLEGARLSLIEPRTGASVLRSAFQSGAYHHFFDVVAGRYTLRISWPESERTSEQPIEISDEPEQLIRVRASRDSGK